MDEIVNIRVKSSLNLCDVEFGAEGLKTLRFLMMIQYNVANGLGYDPQFSHYQNDSGESEMVDLVRHLGEMDMVTSNYSDLLTLIDYMIVSNYYFDKMGKAIYDRTTIINKLKTQKDRLLYLIDRQFDEMTKTKLASRNV